MVPDPFTSGYVDLLIFRFELTFHLVYPTINQFNALYPNKAYPVLEGLCNTLLDEGGGGSSDRRWQVHGDPDGLGIDEERLPVLHSHITVRLVSPEFKFAGGTSFYKEIKEILRRIGDFADESDICILCSTKSTFFVQVGIKREDGGVPFHLAKNLLRIATAFELCFDMLHPISRILDSNLVSAPPSAFLQHYPGLENENLLARVQAIDKFGIMEDIDRALDLTEEPEGIGGPKVKKYPAYYMGNLGKRQDRRFSQELIEFRQHAGTLHPDDVIKWIELCCYLVLSADVHDPRNWRFYSFVDQFVAGKYVDVLEILAFLGMPRSVTDFYSKKLQLEHDEAGELQHRWAFQRYEKAIEWADASDDLFKPLLHFNAAKRFHDENLVTAVDCIQIKSRRGDYGTPPVEIPFSHAASSA